MKVNNAIQTNQAQAQKSQSAHRSKQLDKVGDNQKGSSNKDVQKTADASAEISSRAKEMAEAKKSASEAPDVRSEKIAKLRERIENGDYNTKPEDVADKMVDEHMSTVGIE